MHIIITLVVICTILIFPPSAPSTFDLLLVPKIKILLYYNYYNLRDFSPSIDSHATSTLTLHKQIVKLTHMN